MLSISDLKLREYKDIECIAFVVDVSFGDRNTQRVWFKKQSSQKWNIECILPSGTSFSVVYETYSSTQALTAVAATGLLILQKMLEEVIQAESQLEFSIAEAVRGM